MGGNHLSAGADWPQRLWAGTSNPTGGIIAQDAGPPTMRFNGGSVPYTPIGLEGWPKFGFEKNDRWQFSSDITWVKGRHAIKTGFEFRHHNFPVPGLGRRRRGGQLQLRPPRHRGLRRIREQPEPDRRSVCVVPAGAGADVESDHPGVHGLPRDLHRSVRQRRVQGQRQADADTRPALTTTSRPGPKRTTGTRPSVRRRRTREREAFPARSSSRETARGARDSANSRTSRRMRGVRARASPIGSTTSRLFAAATGCTTRTSRSASSAARRRWVSHRTRLRRTRPTASFRRTTSTRDSRRTGSRRRRSSIRRSISAERRSR